MSIEDSLFVYEIYHVIISYKFLILLLKFYYNKFNIIFIILKMPTRKRKSKKSCKHGKLKKPIRTKNGGKRRCKKGKTKRKRGTKSKRTLRKSKSKRRRYLGKYRMIAQQGQVYNTGDFQYDDIINIKDIHIQQRVLNKLHEYDIHDYDNNNIDNNVEDFVTIQQNRLQLVIDEIDNNTPVYPVEIKRTQLWTPRNAPIRYRYTVMNGNHRITASAIRGFTKIPVKFV